MQVLGMHRCLIQPAAQGTQSRILIQSEDELHDLLVTLYAFNTFILGLL